MPARGIGFCMVKREPSPLVLRYVRAPERLKLWRFLPLFEDLNKSSHNQGLNAARIALIVAASVTAAGARDVHSDFSVSVIVRPVANIEFQSVPAGLEISLKFRFALAPGLAAGSYPWPVRLAVRPLD